MRFIEFKSKFNSNNIIEIRNVLTLFGSLDRRRLYEWQKKGYIRKITNNYYLFTDANINDSMLRMIANKIYAPSYIGLESALSYYEFIPDSVFQITSITSRTPKHIKTDISNFRYNSIKKNLFWGYTLNSQNPPSFFISDPEKTILDYLYFNPYLDNKAAIEETRFNRDELNSLLKPLQLKKYLSLFSHNRLTKTFNKIIKVLDVKF